MEARRSRAVLYVASLSLGGEITWIGFDEGHVLVLSCLLNANAGSGDTAMKKMRVLFMKLAKNFVTVIDYFGR